MQTIICTTNFDITATDVLGQYKPNRDIVNQSDQTPIQNLAAWTRARNQQRNWETITQIIMLRCLPEHIVKPQRSGDSWSFTFSLENLAHVSNRPDDLYYLLQDAHGVPMIIGLDEQPHTSSVIDTIGADRNTWFDLANR